MALYLKERVIIATHRNVPVVVAVVRGLDGLVLDPG